MQHLYEYPFKDNVTSVPFSLESQLQHEWSLSPSVPDPTRSLLIGGMNFGIRASFQDYLVSIPAATFYWTNFVGNKLEESLALNTEILSTK